MNMANHSKGNAVWLCSNHAPGLLAAVLTNTKTIEDNRIIALRVGHASRSCLHVP